MSEGTIKTHVSNILTKLDLRDRVQAVVFGTKVARSNQEEAHVRESSLRHRLTFGLGTKQPAAKGQLQKNGQAHGNW